MGSYIRKFINILKPVFITSLFLFAISCSQNTPEMRNVSYSVIYDYEDGETNPDARLSLFIESESDVRRYERIVVKSNNQGYIWDIDDIKKVQLDNIQYAGVTNLKVPENEIIPSGTYVIKCINADEKETELNVTINYDDVFYELKESEVAEKMREKNGFKKIAIYDKDNIMIYFGVRTKDMQSNRDIWNFYRNAAYYQDIWCIPDNTIMCILPVQEVVPEK